MVPQEQIDEAWSLIHSGKYDDAIKFLDGLIESGNNDAELLRLIGEAHLQAGRPDDAYKAMQRSLRFEPKNFVANNAMALISHAARNLDDACVRYKCALEGGVPSRLSDCENIVLAFAANGDKRTALWIAEQIGSIHSTYKDRLLTFARSVNGFDPNGGLMGLLPVIPVHDGMEDTEKEAVIAARNFLAQHGAGKKRGLLGFLG